MLNGPILIRFFFMTMLTTFHIVHFSFIEHDVLSDNKDNYPLTEYYRGWVSCRTCRCTTNKSYTHLKFYHVYVSVC